ncbi:unnamed protein product [Closterium sp. NIES-65]|nr:unnamed protein product [Closterium sp. NIES-65]
MVAAHGYPAYRCFKTMQRRRPDMHEVLFFCQFWSVPHSAFPSCCIPRLPLVLHYAFPSIPLSPPSSPPPPAPSSPICWIPLYHEAKLAFIIYLWHPRTQGTEIVYGSMLQPLLTRHEPIIDRHLAHLEERGRDMAVECWRAGVAYTGARFEELIAYLASLSAQAAASAALRGMDGSGRREERERRESEVEVLRSERPDGAEGRKGEEEQQEEVRGRRKYLQQYGGEAVQLRSAVGVQKGGYERRLQGEETEGTPNNGRKAEAEEQRVQQGSEQREGVQRQAVRYRNVDSDSDGDGGESDGASGGSGASSEFEMVDTEREFSTGAAADERAAAAAAGSAGTGRGGGSGWWGSKHLAAGLAGLGRALSPSNSQARQAAPPPAMLHGTLPPAALLPAGVAGGQGGGSIDAAAAGFDDVAPDQVDDVAAATVVGEASPHPSGINLRPRRSQRPKKQF